MRPCKRNGNTYREVETMKCCRSTLNFNVTLIVDALLCFIPVFLFSVLSCVSGQAASDRVKSDNSIKGEKAGRPHLTLLRRQISPARVIVHRLEGNGNHEFIEQIPEGEILRVLRGRMPGAPGIFSRLDSAGFFDWPNSILVPPPDLEVDSDPLIILLDTGTAFRRLFTREPHVPPAVREVLEGLDAAVDKLSPAEACLVCIPKLARKPAPEVPQIGDSSDPWMRDLIRALAGPFPVVIPLAKGKDNGLNENRVFLLHAEQGTYVVKCLSCP